MKQFARIRRFDVTAEGVLKEQWRIGRSDLPTFYDARGKLKPICEWPEDSAPAVQCVRFDKNGNVIDIKLWNKVRVLGKLTAHFDRMEKRSFSRQPPAGPSSSSTVTLVPLAILTAEELAVMERILEKVEAPGGLPTPANSADDDVLEGLRRVGYSNLQAFCDGQGRLKPMVGWPEDSAAVVPSVKRNKDGQITEIKLSNEVAALGTLIDHFDRAQRFLSRQPSPSSTVTAMPPLETLTDEELEVVTRVLEKAEAASQKPPKLKM
jgi:hypothetical protein